MPSVLVCDLRAYWYQNDSTRLTLGFSRSKSPTVQELNVSCLIQTHHSLNAIRTTICRAYPRDADAMHVENKRKRRVSLRLSRKMYTNSLQQCDTAQPACSRCKRLGLNCIGGGQRRFKFIQIEERKATKQQNAPPGSQTRAIATLSKPSFALTNKVTWLSSEFASNLQVKDPRFDLSCYGIFLPEVPKRLGSHPALDASASALMSAYPCVYKRQPSPEALSKYGRALRVLRISLDNPDRNKIVEMLCAIYFLLICQVCFFLTASCL
jgi:hypothetical protein